MRQLDGASGNNPAHVQAFANRVKIFLTRDVEWRNRIVSVLW
jgi:hypothetical protein